MEVAGILSLITAKQDNTNWGSLLGKNDQGCPSACMWLSNWASSWPCRSQWWGCPALLRDVGSPFPLGMAAGSHGTHHQRPCSDLKLSPGTSAASISRWWAGFRAFAKWEAPSSPCLPGRLCPLSSAHSVPSETTWQGSRAGHHVR